MINHLPTQTNQQLHSNQNSRVPNSTLAKSTHDIFPIHSQTTIDKQPNNPHWQTQLVNAITDIDELLKILQLSHLKEHTYTPKHFKLRVPLGFVQKMEVGNANDPLLKQVLTDNRALESVQGYQTDPLEENNHKPINGILHKYKSRILITLTGACAIHCRYCFRQHFDYISNTPRIDQINQVIDYINKHPDVHEVILSGGDPLSLNNRRLLNWLDQLGSIEQVHTIRLHTRTPVIIPERLDTELIEAFKKRYHSSAETNKCKLIMVIHCNHANEIDYNTKMHLRKLRDTGVTVLNQSVILSGINDNINAQIALSHRLFDANVLPYYLHLLDKVSGAAYFEVSENTAIDLYWKMLAELPGYLVPKLVREIPNQPFKTPINIYKHQ